MKRRWLVLFLFAVLSIFFQPDAALAQYDESTQTLTVTTPAELENMEWDIANNTVKHLVIKGGTGNGYTFPELSSGFENIETVTIEADKVTAIADNAFSAYSNLTSIIGLKDVTTIGENAFAGCAALTSITGLENVETIGAGAFSGCEALESITDLKNVTTIGARAFAGCSKLATITGLEKVTTIGASAFLDCSNLSSISDLSQVTEIGQRAFSGTALTSFTIPDGVKDLADGVFYGCKQLTTIENLEKMQSIGANAFNGCRLLTSFTWPSNLTTISDNVFANCTAITEFTIPASVTSIGNGAFRNTGLQDITIPANVTSIGDTAFSGCGSLSSVVFSTRGENTPLTIGNSAFQNCVALTGIDLPQGVTTLNYGTFYGCTGLTHVGLPEGLMEIKSPQYSGLPAEMNPGSGYGAFRGCSNLEKINLPSSLTFIGEDTFYGSGLTEITISAQVTEIAARAFAECENLKEVVFAERSSGTNLTIGSGVFQGCTSLSSLALPEGLTSIVDAKTFDVFPDLTQRETWGMFEDCISLTSITLPESLTYIGSRAFYGSGLETVTIPGAVTSVGTDAFSGCDSLSSVSVECSLNLTAAGIPTSDAVALRHQWDSNSWASDDDGHWHPCKNTGCLLTDNTKKDSYASHTPEKDDEDCTTAVVCSECARVTTAACSEHDYGAWKSNGDDTHSRSCQRDGCIVTEREKCTYENGVCTVCQGEQPTEPGEPSKPEEPSEPETPEEPDEPSTPPSRPETPSEPSDPEPEEPSGPSTGSNEGWDGIRDEIANTDDGASIVIDMGDTTEVPADIFEEVAGKDVTVEFDMGDGVKWEVNGADIPADADLSDLNLGVSMNTSGIPVDVINAITGEATSVQITLAHDGDFGFALTLSAPLGEENAGYWANLYHYDETNKAMDFETAAEIEGDGTVKLRLTHASQYAIVIDDHSHAPAETIPVSDIFTDVAPGAWYIDAVQYAYDNGLMTGTSATTFEPNTATTRGMIVSILHRLEDAPVVNYLMTFDDVADGEWYAEAVRWAASENIVAGYSDTAFGPNDPITREQLAAILYNYAEWKGMDVSARADLSRYSDQPSAWADDVMEWAVAEGLISGTSATTLDPQGTATRAQVAAILQRFLEN